MVCLPPARARQQRARQQRARQSSRDALSRIRQQRDVLLSVMHLTMAIQHWMAVRRQQPAIWWTVDGADRKERRSEKKGKRENKKNKKKRRKKREEKGKCLGNLGIVFL